MRTACAIGATLLIATTVVASPPYVPPTARYGRVIVALSDTSDDPTATINIRSWNDESLSADVDSALQAVRSAHFLGLLLAPCDEADSSRVKEIAGRFTPFDLRNLPKSGPWQWDRPLIILMNDSAYCPILLRLSERRWTKILIGSAARANRIAVRDDLIRRYKRERTDRMEDMFRK